MLSRLLHHCCDVIEVGVFAHSIRTAAQFTKSPSSFCQLAISSSQHPSSWGEVLRLCGSWYPKNNPSSSLNTASDHHPSLPIPGQAPRLAQVCPVTQISCPRRKEPDVYWKGKHQDAHSSFTPQKRLKTIQVLPYRTMDCLWYSQNDHYCCTQPWWNALSLKAEHTRHRMFAKSTTWNSEACNPKMTGKDNLLGKRCWDNHMLDKHGHNFTHL